MPDIKFDHIISCSSEDRNHPASNLLKPETYRKWRCEKVGEEHATVIIQLEKETQISAIDIGNNGSATCEVLVGKSSSPDADYQVLLQMSSFMTPTDSKKGENMNRVRMFTVDKLCADVAKKKWDRVMVKCTQPWGVHQYGLSFIALHSPPEDEAPSTSQVGRFTLKDDTEDEIKPGSLFAKWKANKPDVSPHRPKTAAAMISEASSPTSLATMEGVRTKAANIVPKKRENPSSGTAPKAKRHQNGTSSSPKGKALRDNRKALERDSPSPPSPPTPGPARPKKTPVQSDNKQKRPFKQLLSGVTFVLSGFQNPLRADLRQKALDMGAKYQGDWSPDCTHLICAFANTPKVKQVRGSGKLVRREWIEHCHRERRRFPWRRYALDASAEKKDESEEEIWELTSEAPGPSSRDVADDDAEISVLQVPPKSPPETIDLADFDADTDKESDGELLPDLPKLPDVFVGKTFALHHDLPLEDKRLSQQYIVALGGKVADVLDQSVHYLVTDQKEGLDTLEEFYPDVSPVLPTWIYKCNDEEKLVAIGPYKLSPPVVTD